MAGACTLIAIWTSALAACARPGDAPGARVGSAAQCTARCVATDCAQPVHRGAPPGASLARVSRPMATCCSCVCAHRLLRCVQTPSSSHMDCTANDRPVIGFSRRIGDTVCKIAAPQADTQTKAALASTAAAAGIAGSMLIASPCLVGLSMNLITALCHVNGDSGRATSRTPLRQQRPRPPQPPAAALPQPQALGCPASLWL